MSSKNNVFEEFDKLKNELTDKLKKIKEIQSEIKDALEHDKDKKLILKNIEDMKSGISNLNTQITKNIENSFKVILDKINNNNHTNTLKELHKKISEISHDTKKDD